MRYLPLGDLRHAGNEKERKTLHVQEISVNWTEPVSLIKHSLARRLDSLKRNPTLYPVASVVTFR